MSVGYVAMFQTATFLAGYGCGVQDDVVIAAGAVLGSLTCVVGAVQEIRKESV